MTDTDRLAALLREAWNAWDGEHGQPDDPFDWQATLLIASGVTLQPAAPAEGLHIHDPKSCDDCAFVFEEGSHWEPKCAAPAEGLDVERLARALHNIPTLCLAARRVMPSSSLTHAETDQRLAAAIAREYAALTPEDDHE